MGGVHKDEIAERMKLASSIKSSTIEPESNAGPCKERMSSFPGEDTT